MGEKGGQVQHVSADGPQQTVQDRHRARQTQMRRAASGQESVIYHEHEYNITQQKCHLELGMILTFCWQVKAEGIAGDQETIGHLKVYPTEVKPVLDGYLFR